MRVDRSDGSCRTCGGVLKITAAEDHAMEVECTECCDCYEVEPDAFGDGCMTYQVPFMIQQHEAGHE